MSRLDDLLSEISDIIVDVHVHITRVPPRDGGGTGTPADPTPAQEAAIQAIKDGLADVISEIDALANGDTGTGGSVTITLNPDPLGQTTPMNVTQGSQFVDPGATASDGSTPTVAGEVDTNTSGTDTLTYSTPNATDVTREVIVGAPAPLFRQRQPRR